MKRFLARLIPVAVALLLFGMIILGSYLDLPVLTYLAIGLLFGGGFLLAVVATVLIFVRAKKTADKMEEPPQSEEQNAELNEEESVYPENEYDAAEKVIAQSIHGYRKASKKTKALSILFLSSTLGSVFAGLILMFFNQLTAAYVCFGCFAAIILIGILCAVIAPKLHNQASAEESVREKKIAVVVERTPVTDPEAFKNDKPSHSYKYLLEIDGKRYETEFCTRFETGECVAVTLYPRSGFVLIDAAETRRYQNEGKREA